MPIPEYRGRTAQDIVGTEYVEDSAWQIRAALSWCDYAERMNTPVALHYAAFHLRAGIEQLWFEVLFASRGGSISVAEYEKYVKTTTKLYKLIDSEAPHYTKFAEFVEIVGSMDRQPMPPTVVWDIPRLKRIHGECGGRLLHFPGVLARGYLGSAWKSDQMKFLFDSAQWIWSTMVSKGNLAVFRPEGLKPEVQSIWERFRDGLIKAEDVRFSLKFISPILRKR